MDKATNFSRMIAVQIAVGVGAMVVTLLAAFQLPPLIRAREKLTSEVAERKAERDALTEQVTVLRGERDKLNRFARGKDKSVPIEALVRPKASMRELTAEEAKDYPPKYMYYSMWLEAPADVKKKISKVTYFLNHPSFSEPVFTGDPNDSFRTGYYGYGALRTVIITVTLKTGEESKIDFDQWAASQLGTKAAED